MVLSVVPERWPCADHHHPRPLALSQLPVPSLAPRRTPFPALLPVWFSPAPQPRDVLPSSPIDPSPSASSLVCLQVYQPITSLLHPAEGELARTFIREWPPLIERLPWLLADPGKFQHTRSPAPVVLWELEPSLLTGLGCSLRVPTTPAWALSFSVPTRILSATGPSLRLSSPRKAQF